MCFVSGALFLWFAMACEQITYRSTAVLYVSSAIGGFVLNGTIGLFYELAVETTYPVAEGITTGLLTTTNNVIGILFLLAPEVPDIGWSS
jgi:FLVCR family MFS transporter